MLSGQHAATWEEILHHKNSSVTLGCAARLAHFYLFEGYVVGGFQAAFGFPCSGVIAVHCLFSPDLLRSVVASAVWPHVGDHAGCWSLLFCIRLDELEMAGASWKKEGFAFAKKSWTG